MFVSSPSRKDFARYAVKPSGSKKKHQGRFCGSKSLPWGLKAIRSKVKSQMSTGKITKEREEGEEGEGGREGGRERGREGKAFIHITDKS